MQAIAALEKAIIVLAEATSLIQDSSASSAAAWQKARQGVQDVMVKMPSLLALPEEQTSQVTMFLEGGAQAKSPASATIQGILKDMYDTMAEELEKRETDEGDQNQKYEAMIYIKYTEIYKAKEETAKYQKLIAEYEILLADAQLLFAETEKEMKADIEFFDMLKKMCLEKYKEWMIRKKQYADELAGIIEALIKDIDDMIKVLKDEEAEDIEKRDTCKEEYQ